MRERLFELGASEEKEPAKRAPSDLEAAPEGPLRRVMLLVAYDGGPFRGFAAQANGAVPTVAGLLREVLSKMVGAEVRLGCAGRTDAGVHARGQVVHVDLPALPVERWLAREPEGQPGELTRLARTLTAQCGPAVAIWRALVAPAGFDARRSAVARRYSYRLLRSGVPDPLLRRFFWHVPGELDLGAMRIGADGLLGEHDFAAFCKRPPGVDGPINRRVTDALFRTGGDRLVFEIEANAFCHHMVRSIVGSLVAVGQGRMTAADLRQRLELRKRAGDVEPAPPEGLCLELVRYPDELVPGGLLARP